VKISISVVVFWVVTPCSLEVVTAVKISIVVFWVVTPCSLEGGYQRSSETLMTTYDRHKLLMFENKVLRKIFAEHMCAEKGEWKKSHN
jgi:hypothetical protein